MYVYVLYCYREIYHGRRWNSDERFLAPMATISTGEHIFINDIISLKYSTVGFVLGRVTKFF